jgi:hypothetical protein
VKRDRVFVSRSRTRPTLARCSIIGELSNNENKNRETFALVLTIDYAEDTLCSSKTSR